MPTKRPKTEPPRVQAIDMEELLILSVSALVSKFADALTQDNQDEVLKLEAHLYRTLEVECAQKAKLATAFAAERPKLAAAKKAR
jgi:hypothetical protein